ncbi:MAG: hypothetical protein C4520_01405 [Candidatus Abyssobacteria bacterium SURF_5]|uniref:Uncharacterized protein n=1 Tax=Abyssobacteria bacterium (strain SURF_5) TaxID=2093360 RepID=A0A3A4NZU6_ABYX5|nr:MAG: hypothetical protein C4520_01405 [Candidatus Abyssubacteria bacterium SURF_5]
MKCKSCERELPESVYVCPACNAGPQAIQVNSVLEEYIYASRSRCSCGGAFRYDMQTMLAVNGVFCDELSVVCKECGRHERFLFDISSFFMKKGK